MFLNPTRVPVALSLCGFNSLSLASGDVGYDARYVSDPEEYGKSALFGFALICDDDGGVRWVSDVAMLSPWSIA